MPTVILFNRFDDDTQLIWQAAVELGWRIIRGTPSPTDVVESPFCIYGGVMWGQRVASKLGVELAWPDDLWLTKQPQYITHRRISVKSGEELRDLNFPVFIKSLNWKDITSRTYHSKDDIPDVNLENQYLASEVVNFTSEYRAFILRGSILDITRYAVDGLLNISTDNTQDAADFIDTVDLSGLPDSVVLDVGKLSTGEWAVVEANPSWCSGMYGHDPKKVLFTVLGSTLTPVAI